MTRMWGGGRGIRLPARSASGGAHPSPTATVSGRAIRRSFRLGRVGHLTGRGRRGGGGRVEREAGGVWLVCGVMMQCRRRRRRRRHCRCVGCGLWAVWARQQWGGSRGRQLLKETKKSKRRFSWKGMGQSALHELHVFVDRFGATT